MNENLKDQEVLLVKNKDSNKLNVVAGLNEDGTVKSVPPQQKKASDFFKIDKNSDALENFMTNFLRQCKDPSEFQFFRIPLDVLESIVPVLQEMLKAPDNPSNKELLDEHRVLPEAFAQKQYQPIDESRIDWKQFESIGVTKEMLEQTKSLDKMLNWQKTPVLLPLKIDTQGVTIRTDARLSLYETPEGKLSLKVHALRKEPELEKPFYRVMLNEDDKQNLRQTGHAGRLIEIEPVKGTKVIAFASIDNLTNELVAVRADRIKIPNEIKGAKLTENQQLDLAAGKAVFVKDMISKLGNKFDNTIQVNAATRGISFKQNTKNPKLSVQTEKTHNQEQQPQNAGSDQTKNVRIPSGLLGVELSKDQQKLLADSKTIYVTGMIDKAGQPFNAYIKYNFEKSKPDFFKWNPDKIKKVTPDSASQTQVAVNSEGKTNEATKKIKEPLKQGQTEPADKQQKQAVVGELPYRHVDKKETEGRTKGRKM